jgi:hypothetical protein
MLTVRTAAVAQVFSMLYRAFKVVLHDLTPRYAANDVSALQPHSSE